MTMSKTLGGGLPLAAVATTAKPSKRSCTNAISPSTPATCPTPLTAEVGLAVLKVIEQEGLVARARAMGAYLRERLGELQQRHEVIGDIRASACFSASSWCRTAPPRRRRTSSAH